MRFLISSLFIVLLAQTVQAQAACGGSFASFIRGIKTEARVWATAATQWTSFLRGLPKIPKFLKPTALRACFKCHL